jgi:hypothetical protein
MKKFRSVTLGVAISMSAGCASPGAQPVTGKSTPAAAATAQSTPAAATAQPTPPSTPAPDALVSALYKDTEDGPFFQTSNRALVDKYFDKSTADLIWKDAVDSQGEVGALGADPLYDAQDTDIKNFSVHAPEIKDGRAEVVVSFENFKKKERITYLLISKEGAWKITDIKYRDGRTLVKMLKGE